MTSYIRTLTCWLCGKSYAWDSLRNLCECGKPLRVDYELPKQFTTSDEHRSLWRYESVLPPVKPISLGEGLTPLHRAPRFGANTYIKDEGVNPTSSFKARGMAVAVSVAKHLGAKRLGVPSAGNAAGALAAYCAHAELEAHVYMPRDTPQACIKECELLGAKVTLINGLITDCAAAMREQMEGDWFDMSTLREPYRVEGKKTMGYELFEQLGEKLPDAIIYPTGGGTGLIGMWKAFDELEAMNMIDSSRPKMISVQAEGCQPIVRAFESGSRFADEHLQAHTSASGLRVPKAVGDFIMLDLIRASGGTAIAVSDSEMISCANEISSKTGIFAAPEGGATLAAYRRLIETGFLSADETVVLFNTGSGIKYLEALCEQQG